MSSRAWGATGPGAWYTASSGRKRSVATNLFVPASECAADAETVAPEEWRAPSAEAAHDDAAAAEAAKRFEAPPRIHAVRIGLPPPSAPTADLGGEGAPTIEVLDGGAEGGEHAALFGSVGCQDPGCPHCENVKICSATGKKYTPVSPESCKVLCAMIGPVMARVPFRGLDPRDIPEEHRHMLSLSPEEKDAFEGALYLFLRKRGSFLGPVDDILALAGAIAMVAIPRAMVAADARDGTTPPAP